MCMSGPSLLMESTNSMIRDKATVTAFVAMLVDQVSMLVRSLNVTNQIAVFVTTIF